MNLKIRSEIDLRKSIDFENGGISSSVLGNSVKYYSKPLYYGGKNILSYVGNGYDNPYVIKSIFEILADSTNYPLVFYCSQGKDRTGCLAFLIRGLMGESLEDIYRDYLFSNFSILGGGLCSDTDLRGYISLVNKMEGADLSEKIFNYLNFIRIFNALATI